MGWAKIDRMKNYYAARAAEYEQIYHKPERQADLRAIEAWLPQHFTNTRVLDVACGTGYWTQFIAPVAAQVLGVDAAAETLAIARARLPAGKVDLQVADAYALERLEGGGAEGSLKKAGTKFDAAFAGFWFSHVPKSRQTEFLRGLHGMLKPGAKVVLLDNRFVAGSSSPISETDADGNTYQARLLQDGSIHKVLKNFPDEAELQSCLAGLGRHGRWVEWPHFWAFDYNTPD